MTPAWAQRQAAILRDCLVSPDVFSPIVDRLGAFVVPYQQALEAEAGQPQVHRYLAGLLSHLNRKHAETIAALAAVERQVIQDFIGTAPWDHRPLITVLVGQGAERLGHPMAIAVRHARRTSKRCMERIWCAAVMVAVPARAVLGDTASPVPRPTAVGQTRSRARLITCFKEIFYTRDWAYRSDDDGDRQPRTAGHDSGHRHRRLAGKDPRDWRDRSPHLPVGQALHADPDGGRGASAGRGLDV